MGEVLQGEGRGPKEGDEGTHRGDGETHSGRQEPQGGERPFPALTTVELHVLLQVFLKVEGLPAGWLRAGEGLLVNMLVLLVVLGKGRWSQGVHQSRPAGPLEPHALQSSLHPAPWPTLTHTSAPSPALCPWLPPPPLPAAALLCKAQLPEPSSSGDIPSSLTMGLLSARDGNMVSVGMSPCPISTDV